MRDGAPFILEKQVGDRFVPIPGQEHSTPELAHSARKQYAQEHGGLVVVCHYPSPERQALPE